MNSTSVFPPLQEWSLEYVLLFWAIHLVGVEVLQHLIVMNCHVIAVTDRPLENKGKHLDELEFKDKFLIVFNRLCVPLLTYSMFKFMWDNPSHVEWDLHKLTLANTLGSLVGFFTLYDFFYVLLHRFLHIRAIYPWVHKHHHRQHAPSRGNVDAVNVHPFEFLSGEFLHLFAIMVVPCHALTVLVFMVIAGVLASLNHTRYDVQLGVYEVRVHDVHHRIPQSNYGQYTMFWDRAMGSYRSYEQTRKVEHED
ncbi:hypothetical protein BASA81_012523 [Batrachochytrium salamandrivorans]|nr:hypothetical protein BASA81_012523 [Batrachochytrium salamandrivorans]